MQMMGDPVPADAGDLVRWMDNFALVAASFKGHFGLDEATLQHIASTRARLGAAFQQLQTAESWLQMATDSVAAAELEVASAGVPHAAAQDAHRAALATRDRVSLEVTEHLRPLVERLQSASRPPPSSSGRLSLDSASGRGASALMTSSVRALAPPTAIMPARPPTLPAPVDLIATAQTGRIVVLTWNGGGNAPGTSYLIEAAIGTLYRGSPNQPEPSAYQVIATVRDEAAFAHALARVPAGSKVMYRVRAKRDGEPSPYSTEVVVTCK